MTPAVRSGKFTTVFAEVQDNNKTRLARRHTGPYGSGVLGERVLKGPAACVSGKKGNRRSGGQE
jgi:hypothetical protein